MKNSLIHRFNATDPSQHTVTGKLRAIYRPCTCTCHDLLKITNIDRSFTQSNKYEGGP